MPRRPPESGAPGSTRPSGAMAPKVSPSGGRGRCPNYPPVSCSIPGPSVISKLAASRHDVVGPKHVFAGLRSPEAVRPLDPPSGGARICARTRTKGRNMSFRRCIVVGLGVLALGAGASAASAKMIGSSSITGEFHVLNTSGTAKHPQLIFLQATSSPLKWARLNWSLRWHQADGRDHRVFAVQGHAAASDEAPQQVRGERLRADMDWRRWPSDGPHLR